MYGPGFTPHTPRPAADDAPPVQTVSTVEWFFAILLMAIPLVNLIFLLVWAFGDGINPNKVTWARAALLWMGIWFVLSLCFFSTVMSALTTVIAK